MDLQAIYCINLDHRHERWKNVQHQFDKLNLREQVTRFSAINEQPGYVGCRKSHLEVLEKCKNLATFMIVEDDLEFIHNPELTETLEKAFQQLPFDWDMLYLGANLQEPIEQYSENLFTLKGSFCTHAMIFNSRSLVQFILDIGKKYFIKKIDVFYRDHVMPKYNVFITHPMVATQADGYSDITRRQNAYSNQMIENFNRNLIFNND